jgi:hypothetical protein
VHGVDAHGGAGGEGLGEDADPRLEEAVFGGLDFSGRHAERRKGRGGFAAEDSRAFDGDALGENEGVVRARALGLDEAVALDFAEEGGDDDGAVEAVGDLGVAADEFYFERLASLEDLVEDASARSETRPAGGGCWS